MAIVALAAPPFRLVSRFALWTFERRLLLAAHVIFIAAILAPQGELLSRYFAFPLLLVMAGFGLLSPGRRSLAYSNTLVASAIYLVALTLASLADPGAALADVWREFRISVLIVAFLAITGSLVPAFPAFPRILFLVAGTVGAIVAALNIYLFYRNLAPAQYFLPDIRLIAAIGMQDYANSTNLSATYAVLWAGIVATLFRSRSSRLQAALLSVDGAILLLGILSTQARSAWLAIVVCLLVLALTGPPRLRTGTLAGLGVTCIAAMAIPVVREAILSRGSSSRFEVWPKFIDLIAARPIVGYGSFSKAGIVAAGYYFLDQAHNLVLSGWFRGGLTGALAMTFILIGGLVWSYRHWKSTADVLPLCVMATITTAGMFDYQLLATYPAWPWVTFWLPFGLAIGAEMACRIKAKAASGASRKEMQSERPDSPIDNHSRNVAPNEQGSVRSAG